jgi:hypothetical protein
MMKKWILPAILIAVVGAVTLYAVDATYHLRTYADQGRSAGYVVNEGLTSVLDADGNYGISTANRYQLERRTMTIPIGTTDAGVDTVWTQLFTVPAGQTITVTEMVLSAHTEGDEATDTLHCSVLYYSGTAKATLDTAVAQFCVDNDSTIVYADTIYTMTLVDSVFTAGDIVSCWWMGPGGAMTEGEGAAITIEYLLDE